MARVLVFSRTTDYRHESIPHAAQVVADLLAVAGHRVERSEDPASHDADNLAPCALVVWLSTSGDVLDERRRGDFGHWLRAGGAWAGIHSATFSEPGWPEFARIAGARFLRHPEPQPGVLRVADATHPSTAGLPLVWTHTDEWYDVTPLERGRRVLLTVDEASYAGGAMGDPHPVAWHGPYGAGHTWYTALGHAAATYDEPWFRDHLLGGLRSLIPDG